jgi:predicted membrane-bound spermidine synthase
MSRSIVSPAQHDRLLVPASLLFVLSGFAALVYQVAWQRILALHSGVGLYSIAMIVAAFMAGLGLGSHAGGVLSGRLGRMRALRLFAALELGIGVFGAVSPMLYYDWLYALGSRLPSPSWRGGLLHFLALLPPTALMGMSLPFLVRATVVEVSLAGRTIGWLYGFNLVGAALGAACGTWILVPLGGIRGAVLAAAAANVAAGAGGLWLARRADSPGLADTRESVGTAEDPGGRPFALWMSLYALSGFTALSLEILWFRLVDVAVKSTAFTFGTVLSIYLLGNAVGCLYAAPRVRRLARPLWVFLASQCGVLVYSAAVVSLVTAGSSHAFFIEWFVDYWGQYAFFPLGRRWEPGTLVRLYVVLPIVLFGLPTALMGFSFPVLQRAVHDDPRTSGRKVGFLQAANIAGCSAGTLLVGLWGLHVLGTTGTFKLLLGCGLVFAGIGLAHYGRAFVIPAAALVALLFVFPDQDALWRRLHGTSRLSTSVIREDATGVAAMTPETRRAGRRWRISFNGKGNSWFPYGGVHTLLGAAPAVVHAAPVDIAVIGLGSGNTAWAAACREATRSVTVFELSAPQPDLLRRLAAVDALPDLQHLLGDPRVRVVVADGRKALTAGGSQYDLIEADAIWPESAYSGNLYSVEFFEICARRLKPGGVMCTWAPTSRTRSTFQRVFPHVLAVGGGDVLIGSRDPLPSGSATWLARLRQASVYLGPSEAEVLVEALTTARFLPNSPVSAQALNRDLFPRDEFASR